MKADAERDRTRQDDRVRIEIYERLAETGHAPTAIDLGDTFGASAAEMGEALRRLQSRHIVYLDSAGDIWKAGAFAGGPTGHRVLGDEGTWWAPCAWDALAIPATLGIGAKIESACGDCRKPIALEVSREGDVEGSEAIVHVALPAARWYEDVGFT